jgi:hypothetical protein
MNISTELRIKPRYYFNFDSVTCIIGEDPNRPVYLSENTRKSLKDLKIGVSAAFSNALKRRGIRNLFLTSADFWLLLGVVIIKDNNIKKISFQHLSNDGGYQLWLLMLPNIRGAARANNNLVSAETAFIHH